MEVTRASLDGQQWDQKEGRDKESLGRTESAMPETLIGISLSPGYKRQEGVRVDSPSLSSLSVTLSSYHPSGG